MDESGAGQDADASEPSLGDLPSPIDVSSVGDVVLDVTFENSKETIKSARKAWHAATKRPGSQRIPEPKLDPRLRVAYRVELSVLKKHSRYFNNLLGNTQFHEAKVVKDALASLAAQKLSLDDVPVSDLPWINIVDDDEATRSAGREKVFEDLLRILHGKSVKSKSVDMLYVTTLGILADRFDCRTIVSRCLAHDLKFKWPATNTKPLRADGTRMPSENEQVLRQKILVAWLLEQPLRLHNSTREVIMHGSSRWSALSGDDPPRTEVWWDLPDSLERELQFRRECVLNTIASVQRHFLALYSSRERQCKLGYDSSSACDSFQLGQMIKFFTSKELVSVVDFGPSSFDYLLDSSTLDIEELLAALKQCPSYQIDKNHTNCGLRTRMEPILEYIRSMLSSNIVSISHSEWKKNRPSMSWIPSEAENGLDRKERKFEFTRGLAGDQRLRYEGALYADKMARKLFTAESWDWTPEY